MRPNIIIFILIYGAFFTSCSGLNKYGKSINQRISRFNDTIDSITANYGDSSNSDYCKKRIAEIDSIYKYVDSIKSKKIRMYIINYSINGKVVILLDCNTNLNGPAYANALSDFNKARVILVARLYKYK
jgi:hypothetical protein